MSDDVSIAKKLRLKLQEDGERRLDSLTEAILASAIDKNSTAMKIVVDLVEPNKSPVTDDTRTLSDEELMEAMVQFTARVGARRRPPKAHE